jgi:hypothetical protein
LQLLKVVLPTPSRLINTSSSKLATANTIYMNDW